MADTCEQDLAGWAAMDPDQATELCTGIWNLCA